MKRIDPKIKKFVKENIQKFCWEIGVSNYRGDIFYMAEDKEGSDKENVVIAECSTDRRYLTAKFRIFPRFIKHYEDKELERCKQVLAHEVAHIATQHMMDLVTSCYKDEGECRYAWESLTETIGRMAHKLADLEE